MERLQISSNGRFLVTESGRPFFWLGDTAWELFHRSTRQEAARYLENRRLKGFTVIQAVALAELDGLHTPNRYGQVPLLGDDPTRPNEAYVQYVDDVVRMAEAQGLYVGLLPTWGDKVTPLWGVGPLVFDEQNARVYGHFLGQRYRDQPNLVWILGGDRPAVTGEADYRPVWRAMAAGIDEATGGLALVNSHSAAFTVRDSHHVELLHNVTDNTFSSGIAVWDTDHDGQGVEHVTVIGNTVTRANTWDMIPAGVARSGEPPHEAISIAGAYYFEVAYNHVYDCDKEGIDVKETTHHGTIHHNHVHHVDRQGLYVDSWFGKLEDVEICENVVHDCRGAGLILSVENGELVNDVRIHHNLIFDNWGSGIFLSRWGDGPRTNVQVYNNTVHHNGYGTPSPGNEYFWLTGGLYLYSTNLRNVDIRNNIFSDNRGFQVGYSDHYLRINPDVEAVLREKGIAIAYNLIFDRNDVTYPIYVGWPPRDYAHVYAIRGVRPVEGDPLFVDPQAQDFRLKSGSPASGQAPHASGGSGDGLPTPSIGAYLAGAKPDFWWKTNFPPQ